MAATVTATFKDGFGDALASVEVEFWPSSAPHAQGSGVVIVATKQAREHYDPGVVKVTLDGSGAMSQTMEQGNYDVWILGKKQFTIQVPASGTVDIDDDIIVESLAYTPQNSTFRNNAGSLQLQDATTELWHTVTVTTFQGQVVLHINQTGES